MEGQNGRNGLEDRLRNMILNHTERGVSQLAPSGPYNNQSTGSRQLEAAPSFLQPPPGLDLARQGQENLTADSQTSPPLAKARHKRPNQAERRQRSAQLSIPIDTRPQMNYSARPYVSPPAFPHHQYSGAGQSRVQRPHSATFRPPSQGSAVSGAPMTGGAFPPHPRHHPSLSYHGPVSSPGEWQQSQSSNGDQRASFHGAHTLFDPTSPRASRHHSSNSYSQNKLYHLRPEELKIQTDLLEGLCSTIIAGAEIESSDIYEKEQFRCRIENVARLAITQYEIESNGLYNFPPASVQLKCFGSLSSGFATKAADMDLGLLSPLSLVQPDAPGSPIPRLVEKAFLEIGLGARLLTRTRVPIIKVCEKPPNDLRAALLEERAKWETGLPEDLDEDDIHEEPEANTTEEILLHDYKHHDRKASLHAKDDSKPEYKFRSLKQGDKKNLSVYYGSAKGILRKLGGRDLTHSNASDLKKEDLEFLNEFNVAFINGLADDDLRRRLQNYKSLNAYDLTSQPNYRTLLGVYVQIEGEVMAMKWDSREIREKDDVQEQQASSIIRSWRALGNRTTFGQDPIGYAKELQQGFDQLKRIPSLQVMLLSQGQHESAAVYYSRALKTTTELGILDRSSETNIGLHLVIRHYVEGIYDHKIRSEVEEFVSSQPKKTLLLRIVGRRHKSLQLAQEFEKCIEKSLYSEQAAATVSSYITTLQEPMVKSAVDDPFFNLVVPLPSNADRVMSEIRLLGNPARMAPNQPRDPYRDRLEFPKSGVGVQCDINFSAHLALQNTLLLRCYSHCDPRVRPLVLFVKHWAKVRQINSPYRGTLSSYGYVLMMLHYLVNIAQPFVCPNLQQLARPPDSNLTPEQIEETVVCKGKNVQFWRDETEILRLARENALTQNRDSIGHLLRGFFEYYAQSNQMSTVQSRGFDWGRDVLSLRTHGGLLSKQEKGWTGAKTVIEVKSAAPPPGHDQLARPNTMPRPQSSQGQGVFLPDQLDSPPAVTQPAGQTAREVKEVRHRYLFAIEDPFELDHNVARTVTHNGIVAIRDEFRRAWGIIKFAGKNPSHPEDLLEDIAQAEERKESEQFAQLLEELHGP